MPLFPEQGIDFNDKDRSITKRMEMFYENSISMNMAFWQEADIDTRFEAGDQSVWNQLYGNLPANQRRQFSFNRIRRIVSMVDGYQRRNRKSTIVTPIENSDEQTADQFTKIMYWINQQEGVLETVSDSFHGALTTGMNLLHVWVDYRSDPVSGNIKVDNCSYNSFLIDPFFRKADLSDCNAIWKRSMVTKTEAMSLLPEHKEAIEGLPYYDSNRDGKFQFLPETYSWSQRYLVSYDEYYYRDFRKQKMLVDTQTGESLEWRSDDKEKLEEFLRIYPQVTMVEQDIPTVNVAILVQGKVFYDGPNPIGIDSYPFVPVLGYYNPQIPYFPWRIQGMVRGLRDAQYLYNRRKVIELDILESQINSGWKYKENALVNPKDVFLTGQGRGLALKEEAQMSDVEQIMPPGIPPSMFQLSESLSAEISQISGVNEELLGSATDDKAGILAQLRQGAGLTTLQGLFDGLDRSQKLLGKIILQIVQANFTPGKIQRIIEEQPTEQFYNKNFGHYDCAIEEGANTTTQRQLQFMQLLNLKEVGVNIPDDVLLKAATVQDKKELVDRIKQQNEQASQQAQMQQQIQMEEVKANIDLAKARTVADQGLGMERVSRIAENQQLAVERQAEAEKDRMSALLDMTKALKEIESIDINHIHQLIAISNLIKQGDMSAQAAIAKNAGAPAAAPEQVPPQQAAPQPGVGI